MRCPFLQETVVRQCRSAGVRMMIRMPEAVGVLERCSTPQHRTCPHHLEGEAETPAETCPFLGESPMQFCSAAPLMKFIPHSEPSISRCGSERHRYCDEYLTLEGTREPERLAYAPNHLWFDGGDGEAWHIGIDGLMAKMLHRIERVSFLTGGGVVRPAVVLTVRGVDLHLAFPQRLAVTGVHSYLRERPGLITDDPYGRGWLFEGDSAAVVPGLMQGAEAREWMANEGSRLAHFAHERAAAWDPTLAGDGGAAVDGLIEHLNRDEILALFHEFFPAYPKGD
jgi:glycine cleavage system H lipoate-binding protein